MFVPGQYRPRDPEWVRDTIRDHPLALLLTNGVDEPLATHLPVIAEDSRMAGGRGSSGLEGLRLFGHMNRANPHWSALHAGTHGVVVFTGSSAYVTPVWYGLEPASPTWDFVAVHVHVRIEPIPAGEPTLTVVRKTARRLEDRFGLGWDQRPSLDYFRRIVPGVGAFAMDVVGAEGMYKLSQEKDATTREKVRTGLRERGLPGDDAVAADIERLTSCPVSEDPRATGR